MDSVVTPCRLRTRSGFRARAAITFGRVIAAVHGYELNEAAQEQPGAGQQHQREHHLRRGERRARPVRAEYSRTAPRTWRPPSFRVRTRSIRDH